MRGQFLWINKNDSAGPNVGKSSRAERSAVQSQVQYGRPRKRKSKARPTPTAEERPLELCDSSTKHMKTAMDPFNTTSFPIDNLTHGMLRYYVYYYHPSQWPNETPSSVDWVVKTAISDQLMMSCLLTAAACRMQYVDRLPYPNVRAREDEYVTQALRLMQERIVDMRGRTEFLQCVLFLMAAESYRGDYEASRMHLRAAIALLGDRGGVEAVKERDLQGQLLMGDLFLACIKLEACLCGDFYDPGPAETLGLQPHDGDGMGTAFKFACIPYELKDLAQQIVEAYRVRIAQAPGAGQWITKRLMAIRNKLLAFESHDALRTAMIMWTLLAMNITGRVKTVKIMAENLRGLVSGEEWEGSEDLQIWILLVGLACATEGSDTEMWFAERVVQGVDANQEDLVDVLEAAQSNFLYHPPVQRPRMVVLTDLIRRKET